MSYTPPAVDYRLLDDDGFIYAVQYIFTKLASSPLAINSTYTISLDTTNQWIVLTDNDGETSHVSYSDFGDQNVIETVKVDNSALTPDANKAVNIPAAGANTRGVMSEADVNTLISAALEAYKSITYIKITSYSALPAAYVNNQSYAQGSYCFRDNLVYVANTAVSGEVWTPAHWTFVSNLFGTIFLVPNSGTTPNIYDEYVWAPIDTTTNPITYGWEKIGTTAVDLSGYVQTTDIYLLDNEDIEDIVDDAYDTVWPTT